MKEKTCKKCAGYDKKQNISQGHGTIDHCDVYKLDFYQIKFDECPCYVQNK